MLDHHDDDRTHHVGMTVHAFMAAADDVRRLSDAEIRNSEDDLRLTVAVLLRRLGQPQQHPDTS